MTLEEAIKHCEEVAEEKEKEAYEIVAWIGDYDNLNYNSCRECASEHRQLAKWLKELKAYRKAYEEIKRLPIAWEFGEGVIRCLTIIEDCLEEVKADEDSD